MDRQFPHTIDTDVQTGSGNVRVTFGWDDANPIRVLLNQAHLLSLMAELQKRIERNSMAPISLGQLRPGKMIAMRGFSSRRLPDGSLVLELVAEFEDRVVTIPFSVPPQGVADIHQATAPVAND